MSGPIIFTPKLVDADGVVTKLQAGDKISWIPESFSVMVFRESQPLRTQVGNDTKVFAAQIRTEEDFFVFIRMTLGMSGFNFIPYRWGAKDRYPAVTIV